MTREVSESLSPGNVKDENPSGLGSLKRMHDEIRAIQDSDRTVIREMNNFHLQCDLPPLPPRCYPIEWPPNPAEVDRAMTKMTKANQDLQAELDALRPEAPRGGTKFEQDFAELEKQAEGLGTQVKKLSEMTFNEVYLPETRYDEERITKEAELIEKMAESMEKTRMKMERDWSPNHS